MKKPSCVLPLAGAIAALVACVEDPSIGTLVHEDAARPRPGALVSDPEADVLVGRAPDGRLHFVDVPSFHVRAALRPPEGDGPLDASLLLGETGLVHALLLAHDEEDQSGFLALRRFDGHVFGRSKPIGPFDGLTRGLAVRQGAVVFQESMGARWKLVRFDEVWTPSLACPMPTSILDVREQASGTTVRALARSPEDEPVLLRVAIDDAVAECARLPVDAPLTQSARAAALPEEDVVVDAVAGGLHVGPLDASSEPVATGIEMERVEAVTAWSAASPSRIVVLGSTPPVVAVVDLDLEEGFAVETVVSHPLEGAVEEAWTFFRRDVAVVGETLFVATSAGLEAFELTSDGLASLALPEAVRDLRSPILAF